MGELWFLNTSARELADIFMNVPAYVPFLFLGQQYLVTPFCTMRHFMGQCGILHPLSGDEKSMTLLMQ